MQIEQHFFLGNHRKSTFPKSDNTAARIWMCVLMHRNVRRDVWTYRAGTVSDRRVKQPLVRVRRIIGQFMTHRVNLTGFIDEQRKKVPGE